MGWSPQCHWPTGIWNLCFGLGSFGSRHVSRRWTQAVVAHSPHAKDYLKFLRHPPSTTVPIILPLWQREEILDLRQVVFSGMSQEQVCEWHLLQMETEIFLCHDLA